MKIRITKCSKPTYWYAYQIGSTFNVQEDSTDPIRWLLFQPDQREQIWVSKTDCEVLPEDKRPMPEPFDLEAALLGAIVVTRDGRAVTQISSFDAPNSLHTELAVVIEGEVCLFFKNGRFSDKGEHGSDLLMAPKKPKIVTRWIIAGLSRKRPDEIITYGFWASQSVADEAAANYPLTHIYGSFPVHITLNK